jgi:hypothetical protein
MAHRKMKTMLTRITSSTATSSWPHPRREGDAGHGLPLVSYGNPAVVGEAGLGGELAVDADDEGAAVRRRERPDDIVAL